MTLLDRVPRLDRSLRLVHKRRKPRTWRDITLRDIAWPSPLSFLSTIIEPLAVLYLGYLLVDTLHRLLMKTTDLGGILRFRNPGLRYLAIGAVLYLAMTGGEVRAIMSIEYLLEATKVLLLADSVKAVRKWCRGNWVGVGRAIKKKEGREKKDDGETGTGIEAAEIRRLREERIKALESAAAAKRGLKVVHKPKERAPEDVTARRRLGGKE
jgi:hypothetical protein